MVTITNIIITIHQMEMEIKNIKLNHKKMDQKII
jgi:hypothetical protein